MTFKMGCGTCDARWEVGTPRTCKCVDPVIWDASALITGPYNYPMQANGRFTVDPVTGNVSVGSLPHGINHAKEMTMSSDYTLRVSSDNTLRGSDLGTPPKFVGEYQIGDYGGLLIRFKKKPIWLHRFMTKLLLGFVWKDLE
jgi:hypothetical protein